MFLYKQANSSKWHIRWWDHGRPRNRSTGTDNQAAAQQILAEMKALAARTSTEERLRTLIDSVSASTGERMTASADLPLDQIWTAYTTTQHARDLAKRSLGSKRNHLDAMLAWLAEKYAIAKTIRDITPRMAATYLATFGDASPVTYNNHLSTLRSIWDALANMTGNNPNPWSGVQRAGTARHVIRKQAFTIDQMRRLYAAACAKGGWWPAAICLGYHCGLRWGDCCELRWDEISPDATRLMLADDKTRRYNRGEIAHDLPEELRAHLPERQPSGYVWPEIATAHAGNAGNIGKDLRTLFESAGIEMWRDATSTERRRRAVQIYGFHSLRHTYVTLLRDAGLNRDDIADLVGHGSPHITARYDHSIAAGKKAAGKLPSLTHA